MKRKKIFYIAGYSRSGSTILDIMLGSLKDVTGTGELSYLFDDWGQPDRACTCSDSYPQCTFWKDFSLPGNITMPEAKGILRQVESRSSLTRLTNDKLPLALVSNYTSIQTALYNYIFSRSGTGIIVDSSKTSRDMAGRFYALQKYTPFDVYVIHLVKNGLSTVESYVKKGSNWALEGHGKNSKFIVARSSLGWWLANSISQKLGEQMPLDHYIRIRYEDLSCNPQITIQKLAEFLSIDLSELSTRIQNETPFQASHNVGGNRLRLEKEIRFAPSTGSRKIVLSSFHRFIFNLIAGRLQKQFGY